MCMISCNLQKIIHNSYFFFSFQLLLVLRGHSFLSPPQRPMTFDFEGFSIPDFNHYIYFPILNLEEEPVFPLMFSAKQGHYWNLFRYDAVLDWGLNSGSPPLEASTLPLGYQGGGILTYSNVPMISIYLLVQLYNLLVNNSPYIKISVHHSNNVNQQGTLK